MPARSLIFVRHSLPEIDPALPASSWQLSAQGRRRCLPLAGLLAPYLPARLLSSPEAKARQTAEILAHGCGIPLAIESGLGEHARQNTPFTSREEFTARVAELFARPAEIVMGEESADQAYARFSAVVDSALQSAPDTNLVIVTHGTVLALWAGRRLALQPFSFWLSQTMPCMLVCDPLASVMQRYIRYDEALDRYAESTRP